MSDTENKQLEKKPIHRFKPGDPGGPGRPKGVGFKALLRHIADEHAAGGKTFRELLIDKAFNRALVGNSDYILIQLMRSLDDEPQQVEIIRRRLELRSTKPAPPVGVNRFAEQNGNGNGHAGTNGNGHA